MSAKMQRQNWEAIAEINSPSSAEWQAEFTQLRQLLLIKPPLGFKGMRIREERGIVVHCPGWH
jgi:hypothetical protein